MTPYDKLPETIKDQQRFCCWKYEKRQERKAKVPYDPVSGRRARADQPESFRDYVAALTAVAKYDGIGFLVGNGINFLDLDNCFTEFGLLTRLSPLLQSEMKVVGFDRQLKCRKAREIGMVFLGNMGLAAKTAMLLPKTFLCLRCRRFYAKIFLCISPQIKPPTKKPARSILIINWLKGFALPKDHDALIF